MDNRRRFRMLVLTDHTTHREGESIYPLLRTMATNDLCSSIDVASRGNSKNNPFFYEYSSNKLFAVQVDQNFNFNKRKDLYMELSRKVYLSDFDVVFLRMDRPIPDEFFDFLMDQFPEENIINRPSGIRLTGSKRFLLRFPELCPPMKLCHTIEDIEVFRDQFPIVLKPLQNFGGKGLIRINGEKVWIENQPLSFENLKPIIEEHLQQQGPYLAMKYLNNVTMGDKRIIVVKGKIMGAILRIPQKGSWLSNLSMGASAHYTEPDSNEREIANTISQPILEQGVVIFGFDTLMNDDGKRVLSEINTLNVGGLYEAELYSGKPVLQMASNSIWEYISENS